MQFAVPQFTDVEDKLIGPLTLKQFLIMLAAGGVVLLFYSILGLSIFFYVFALPIAGIGLYLCFGKFNGRPVFGFLGAFLYFFSRPTTRIFKRVEPSVMIKRIEKPAEVAANTGPAAEAPDSRLKKLAYLLDQKVEEEKDLLGNSAK